MFLYLLKPTEAGEDYQSYDCYEGHVVASNSSTAARTMVPGGDECRQGLGVGREDFWTNPELSTCTIIGQANVAVPRVVLSSFNAG